MCPLIVESVPCMPEFIIRVGRNHVYIHGISAWNSPDIRSYTVYMYGSGQSYLLSLK